MQEIMTFISNHPVLSLSALIIFVLIVVIEFIRARQKALSLTPSQATQLINRENAVVIDVRANDLYRKGHIVGAVSLPAQEILETPKKVEKFRAKPIIVVCGAGVESQKVAALLQKQGYNAYSLTGGMRAWDSADMPVVKE
ncbi:rhodanese-like domain-containing protein [Aquicella lusitana]|uniref:Rhodanese-related sulfurtransferase n=1 Tax=Aquicella lusitana TaxID=254246 RepID=A0A370GER4_9COXI|nr:rhodanese-like domain-containing protein [Aquicella lusitana]RDI41696.1 rhodanese-related sulfurtransferase [Aquicella lusitana]VVC72672.1 Thiosulfate sulfurtransferase GlpE [Aquicella lusitana]